MDLLEISKVFKALSDESRLKIINKLKEEEQCACQLLDEFDFSQSGLSYQMKILCESGIVKQRPEGKWIHYSIDKEGTNKAIELLKEVTGI